MHRLALISTILILVLYMLYGFFLSPFVYTHTHTHIYIHTYTRVFFLKDQNTHTERFPISLFISQMATVSRVWRIQSQGPGTPSVMPRWIAEAKALGPFATFPG